jgi:arylamine N-acetyltransferase
VKRKGVKLQQRHAKPEPAKGGDTHSLLPMEIQIGDRFTDEGFEWRVLTHPAALHGGKSLRARVQRAGLPETERDKTWPAHVRVEIRRGTDK